MKQKYEYYVALMQNDGTLKYVTTADNSKRTFNCESKKPALKLIESRARNLQHLIIAEFNQPAIVLTVPAHTHFLCNKGD